MKRLISLLLILSMILSLAACSGSSSGSASGGETTADNSGGYSVDTLEVNIWDSNQQAGIQQIADEWSA